MVRKAIQKTEESAFEASSDECSLFQNNSLKFRSTLGPYGVDSKKRIILPIEYRKILLGRSAGSNKLYFCLGKSRFETPNIAVYDSSTYNEYSKIEKSLPYEKRTILPDFSFRTDFDRAGRVLIPSFSFNYVKSPEKVYFCASETEDFFLIYNEHAFNGEFAKRSIPDHERKEISEFVKTTGSNGNGHSLESRIE